MKITVHQMSANPNLLDAFLSTKIPDCPAEAHNGRMYIMPHQFGPEYPELWSPCEDIGLVSDLLEEHKIGVQFRSFYYEWAASVANEDYSALHKSRTIAQLLVLASVLNRGSDEFEIPDRYYDVINKEN